MAEPIPSFSLAGWTQIFADTLGRLYPAAEPADALAIAHGRFFVDEGLQPVQAAELYALSEGSPAQRSGQISQKRLTFRGLTGRFMDAPAGADAFVTLAKDAKDLIEEDPSNAAIYIGVGIIAAKYVRQFETASMSVEDAKLRKEKVMRACFKLVVALTCDFGLRARTLQDVLADFTDLTD
jgi:hypothetical protein